MCVLYTALCGAPSQESHFLRVGDDSRVRTTEVTLQLLLCHDHAALGRRQRVQDDIGENRPREENDRALQAQVLCWKSGYGVVRGSLKGHRGVTGALQEYDGDATGRWHVWYINVTLDASHRDRKNSRIGLKECPYNKATLFANSQISLVIRPSRLSSCPEVVVAWWVFVPIHSADFSCCWCC
jgi:hypothetical protein